MTQTPKKKSRIFNYFAEKEEQFSGGLSWCAGCTMELTARFIPKVLGKDIVLVGCPSCSAVVLYGQNTEAWHRLSYYSCLMTGVASSATGISRYLQRTGNDATVVCFTGDGCAADVGFQPLSGAAERNERVIYICYDNEGYMNTGYQRSSTTPFGASTSTTPVGSAGKGKPTPAKNVPLLMALHGIPYAATATLSNMEDFARKLLKAKEKRNEGFVYIHVFAPCVMGWRFDSSLSIEVCRTAVKTNYFPLWEAEGGKFRLTHEVADPKPVQELTRLVRKFAHFKEDDLRRLQQIVDERYSLLKNLCTIST
ncbi:MAG: pyruvate synthase subunit PorB [Candidatus Riflebacteria bacterium RBG_13_59_9]|nr:MAG: pyruvate synthase subunit PorB [Candidatus Riflebacteria bacterium RBG_13_59_9]